MASKQKSASPHTPSGRGAGLPVPEQHVRQSPFCAPCQVLGMLWEKQKNALFWRGSLQQGVCAFRLLGTLADPSADACSRLQRGFQRPPVETEHPVHPSQILTGHGRSDTSFRCCNRRGTYQISRRRGDVGVSSSKDGEDVALCRAVAWSLFVPQSWECRPQA